MIDHEWTQQAGDEPMCPWCCCPMDMCDGHEPSTVRVAGPSFDDIPFESPTPVLPRWIEYTQRLFAEAALA